MTLYRSHFLRRARQFQAFAWGEAGCTCRSQRRVLQHARASSTAVPSSKPYYVTTPIFYVNAEPHVGHLYTLVLADIYKRWRALSGQLAVLCTGTDEHGMKIQRAAEKANIDPKSLCDENASHFMRLAEAANIDYNHFIRTTEPDHRFAVQHFWLILKERGFIYQSKHEGWYSVSDETFYPAAQVHRTLDPSTGRTFMASIETGKEVEWTSEDNYHFRLSAFREQLLEHYKANPDFIVPETRMHEVVNEVTAGLSDLSVSRPASRLTWGIPVPDDEHQTIYVWLDALINYLTKANYPFQIPGLEHAAGWPPDIQVIGKDIVRFHCIYWPAFLMALNIPLPKQLLTHAHWTMGRQKMSKSVGNVVNPFFAIDRFGVDGMRYFLAHNGGIRDDTVYDNSLIVAAYKKGLGGGIGNLVSRLVRSKKWSVRDCVKRATSGPNHFQPISTKHLALVQDLPGRVRILFDKLEADVALRTIMNVVYETNSYISAMAPWTVADNNSPDAQADVEKQLTEIVYTCAESLRICGLLLQPFMPDKMKTMLDMLGVEEERRLCVARNLLVGADEAYGTSLVPLGKGTQGVLFPQLATED